MHPSPQPRDHVFIVDGTLSTLAPGDETNAGLLYKLLSENGPEAGRVVRHHAGVQGKRLDKWLRAASGAGINDAICAGYAELCSRWAPGDRIFLFGYSRGAYAVRSLAGLIDRVGLLTRENAIERRVQRAFRHYQRAALAAPALRAFARRFCHRETPRIEMIGAWDTVKALGLPWPVLSRIHPMATEFHDDRLGASVRNAFHALALDEDRTAFAPVMWRPAPDWRGRLEQVWFPGAHGDVGGHVGRRVEARPLSNLSLVWMLERAERCGLALPEDWRARFAVDPCAPMIGARNGVGRLFLFRAPRRVSAANGEDLHWSVAARMEGLPGYRPRAVGLEAEA